MERGLRTIVIAVAVVVAGVAASFVVSESGVLDVDVWEREDPLPSPIAVTCVRDGAITLSDGRVLRPAGVTRRESVSVAEYDNALCVIVAQGVVVTRDLGDGTAFLLAEPRFYNWCGTRGYHGNPWARWAGSYIQCPLSELLVGAAYADVDLNQSGMTAREIWRLEGVGQVCAIDEEPMLVSRELGALRYDGGVTRHFADFDTTLEVLWRPAPSP